MGESIATFTAKQRENELELAEGTSAPSLLKFALNSVDLAEESVVPRNLIRLFRRPRIIVAGRRVCVRRCEKLQLASILA